MKAIVTFVVQVFLFLMVFMTAFQAGSISQKALKRGKIPEAERGNVGVRVLFQFIFAALFYFISLRFVS